MGKHCLHTHREVLNSRSVSHTYTELISTYSLSNTDSNIQNLHDYSRRRSWRPTRCLLRRQKNRAVFTSPQKHWSVACNKQQNHWFHFTLSLHIGTRHVWGLNEEIIGKKKAALKTWIPQGRRTLVQDVSSHWPPKSLWRRKLKATDGPSELQTTLIQTSCETSGINRKIPHISLVLSSGDGYVSERMLSQVLRKCFEKQNPTTFADNRYWKKKTGRSCYQ